MAREQWRDVYIPVVAPSARGAGGVGVILAAIAAVVLFAAGACGAVEHAHFSDDNVRIPISSPAPAAPAEGGQR